MRAGYKKIIALLGAVILVAGGFFIGRIEPEKKLRQLDGKVQDLEEQKKQLLDQREFLNRKLEQQANKLNWKIDQLQSRLEMMSNPNAVELNGKPLRDKRIGLWEIQLTNYGDWAVLVKEYKPGEVTAKQLVAQINHRQFLGGPPVEIQLTQIKDGIAFLRVSEGSALTQGMGSTGPLLYTTHVVLTLTSLPEINRVRLYGFEEGDHFGPGTFSREDIADWFSPHDGERKE